MRIIVCNLNIIVRFVLSRSSSTSFHLVFRFSIFRFFLKLCKPGVLINFGFDFFPVLKFLWFVLNRNLHVYQACGVLLYAYTAAPRAKSHMFSGKPESFINVRTFFCIVWPNPSLLHCTVVYQDRQVIIPYPAYSKLSTSYRQWILSLDRILNSTLSAALDKGVETERTFVFCIHRECHGKARIVVNKHRNILVFLWISDWTYHPHCVRMHNLQGLCRSKSSLFKTQSIDLQDYTYFTLKNSVIKNRLI